jgi:hypothetical protein
MMTSFTALYQVMFFEKKQLNNCLTASFRKQNLESRTVIFFEFIKKKKQYLLSKEIDATEFYTFRYKNQLFLLLFGQIVLFSGWSQKIQQILEKSINQVDDQIENVYLKDHTYSEEKNSRRLRSLGGSLRKMFSLIESSDKVLTKKEIIKDLAKASLGPRRLWRHGVHRGKAAAIDDRSPNVQLRSRA